MNTDNIEIYISKSECDTADIASKIAPRLAPGSIVTLDGDLGAGKTVFARGLIKALGVDEYVTSPSFVIMNVYGDNIYHFDVYRISDPEEMYEIGYEEYINGDGLCIIEWSELIEDMIPEKAIRIRIEKDDTDFDLRRITVRNLNGTVMK